MTSIVVGDVDPCEVDQDPQPNQDLAVKKKKDPEPTSKKKPRSRCDIVSVNFS